MIYLKLLVSMVMILLFILFTIFTLYDDSEDKMAKGALNFGVLFVITSSLIFSFSTWEELSSNFKSYFLIGETLIFILFGGLLKYLVKLKNTGNSLLFVGSILLNITYLYIGYINIFNGNFTKFIYLYLASLFLIDVLISLLIKILNKSNNYLTSLLSFIPIPFLIAVYFTNDVIFSFSVVSLVMLVLNVLKGLLFKNKKIFNIINIILISILSFVFMVSCVYEKINIAPVFLGKMPLIILVYSIIGNMFTYLYKQENKAVWIIVNLLGFSLINIFALFCLNALTSSIIIFIYSVLTFVIYYLSKNKNHSMLVTTYLLLLESSIIICFSKTLTFIAPIISLLSVLLSVFNYTNENKRIRILDYVMRIIFIIMLFISIIIQPMIIKYIKFIDLLSITNLSLLALYIFNNKKDSKKASIYLILSLSFLIIGTISTYFYSILYVLIFILLIAGLYFSLDKNRNHILRIFVSVLFIIELLIGFHKYIFYASLAAIIVCTLFMIFNKKDRHIYFIIMYIPINILLSNLPIKYSLDVYNVVEIIKLFTFSFVVSVIFRKLFKASTVVCEIIESLYLLYCYMQFAFCINISVGLCLGLISLTMLIVGYILKYKSFIISGYAFTIFTIIIQTAFLWSELPWGMYILILGIVLIVIALVKEINKSGK